MVQMVMIGEQTGTLDTLLNKVAAIYEAELDDTIEAMGQLLEPLLVLFLGIFIGGLVIAIYLPIFNMMKVMG